MKELSIEQKAEAYDKAIAYARLLLKTIGNATLGNLVLKNEFKNMFPVLEESEDEEIRERLIQIFKSYQNPKTHINPNKWEGLKICNIIAWLEKQGKKDEEILVLKDQIESLHAARKAMKETYKIELEKQDEQKPVDKIQLGKKYKCIASPRYSTFMIGEIYKPEDKFLCSLMNLCSDCFEPIEDGEQKPADKVKPKFKVDDIISDGISEVKIVSIDKNYYIVTNDEIENDANVCNWVVYLKDQDNWKLVEQNLDDKAKPKSKAGDWVVCNNGPHHIFQVIERSWPNAKYRNINGIEILLNVFTLDKQYHLWTIQDAKDGDVLAVEAIEEYYQYPFVAIYKEHGLDFFNSYCFIGFDGKFYKAEEGHSIKEIHPATKEQRDLLFQKMKEAGYEWDAEKKELKKIESYSLRSIIKDEPSPAIKKVVDSLTAWSEEDEEYTKSLLHIINGTRSLKPNEVECHKNWVKSLKDRIQPQNFTVTDDELAQAKKDAYNDALDKIEYHSGEPTFDDGWGAAIWYLKKRNMQPQPKQEWSERDGLGEGN